MVGKYRYIGTVGKMHRNEFVRYRDAKLASTINYYKAGGKSHIDSSFKGCRSFMSNPEAADKEFDKVQGFWIDHCDGQGLMQEDGIANFWKALTGQADGRSRQGDYFRFLECYDKRYIGVSIYDYIECAKWLTLNAIV